MACAIGLSRILREDRATKDGKFGLERMRLRRSPSGSAPNALNVSRPVFIPPVSAAALSAAAPQRMRRLPSFIAPLFDRNKDGDAEAT